MGIKAHSEWPWVVQQMLGRIALVTVPTVSLKVWPQPDNVNPMCMYGENSGEEVVGKRSVYYALKRKSVKMSQQSHKFIHRLCDHHHHHHYHTLKHLKNCSGLFMFERFHTNGLDVPP